jgi:hypothetical protein
VANIRWNVTHQEDSIMRRVLAVLISVLTAVWPLLLPQPVSANPCGVTTNEGYVSAKAGHYFGQEGSITADQSGSANGGIALGGHSGNATGSTGSGGEGKGGFALNLNAQKAKGGYASASQFGLNAQASKNEGEIEKASTGGGDGGHAGALSVAASKTEAENKASGNAVNLLGGNSVGGDGGYAGNGYVNLLPIANDANGAQGGAGGDTEGKAEADADSYTHSTAKAYGGDGGAGGAMSNRASQTNTQSVSNDDNTAIAKGGKNDLTSANTANGGTGGSVTGSATSGVANGGSANGAPIAERTVGSNTKAVSDIDAVSSEVNIGGAWGDPCHQTIRDSVGVMAVNGVNDIKSSVMQNVNANLGNAANTSVNLGELGLNRGWGHEKPTPGTNININPNTNQNTNIISF